MSLFCCSFHCFCFCMTSSAGYALPALPFPHLSFSLHSIPFDDPLQSFREFCSYLIIFIKHNILFYLIMTFSVFPNLRCPGVTKHGQNFESADQDWPDVPGFFYFHIPFTHRLRHLSLAHILTDDRIACIDRLFDLSENLSK